MALSSTGQRSSTRAASKAAAINIATIARKESGQANDIESYNDDNGSSKKRKRASTSASASASTSASTSSSSRKKTKQLTDREKTELKAKRSRERMGKNKNTMCIHYSDEEVRAAQEEALQKSLKLVKASRRDANVSKFNLSYQPTKEDMQSPSAECQSLAKWMAADIASLHQNDVPKRIDYSDETDPRHMLMDRQCHITSDPPGTDPSDLHFHVLDYKTGRLGCNGGCGSNGGEGFLCTNVSHLRGHIETCQDLGNVCRTCGAKSNSLDPRALSTHESKCETDEEFNANLEKVRRLLPPPGREWKYRLGFGKKEDGGLFLWLTRKLEGRSTIGSVGGERRKKLEALGYTKERGFFLS